jgi:hypothetical protein
MSSTPALLETLEKIPMGMASQGGLPAGYSLQRPSEEHGKDGERIVTTRSAEELAIVVHKLENLLAAKQHELERLTGRGSNPVPNHSEGHEGQVDRLESHDDVNDDSNAR